MNLSYCPEWRFVDFHPASKDQIIYVKLEFSHVIPVGIFLSKLMRLEP